MRTFRISRPVGCLCAAIAMAGALLASPMAKAEEVTIYSAMAKEHFAELVAALQEREPDLKINQLLDSNGPIMARLLAEQQNPRADVILSASVPGLIKLEQRGIEQPYAPEGLDQIKDRFRDTRSDPPHWIGTDAWASAVCFNTAEGERHDVPEPTSWEDLADPQYKGMITMPNPSSSATRSEERRVGKECSYRWSAYRLRQRAAR